MDVSRGQARDKGAGGRWVRDAKQAADFLEFQVVAENRALTACSPEKAGWMRLGPSGQRAPIELGC